MRERYDYWGNKGTYQISDTIFDYNDDFTTGVTADYSSFLTSPNTDAPISPPKGLIAMAGTDNIALSWAANLEGDTAGYRVYWGTSPGSYTNAVDVGNVTSHTITGLAPGTYYVTVTAYDTTYNLTNDNPATFINENQMNGNESWFAGEKMATLTPVVTHTITASAGANGSISPSGSVTVNHIASQSFTVTPSSGYQAVMSGTCGGNLVGSTYTTNPITEDCTVTANFNLTGSSQIIPTGENVEVQVPVSLPSGGTATVTVEFDEVTSGGTLEIVATDTPPGGGPPDGFRFLGTYYDVTFSGGSYDGYIYVTLPYDDSSIPAGREGQLKLFHRQSAGGGWYDCTYSLDTVNNKITGRVTSLSPFGAGYPTGAITGANTYMITVLAFIAISAGVFLIKNQRRFIAVRMTDRRGDKRK